MEFTKLSDFLSNKTNFHTHTDFCDGKSNIPELVETAKARGFKKLGFSSHSMWPFSSDYHMLYQNFEKYCEVIREISRSGGNGISTGGGMGGISSSDGMGGLEILLGFEGDYIPGITEPTFENYKAFNPDYLIGSVHYIYTEKGSFEADGKDFEVKAGIEKYFKGNGKKCVQTYFDLEKQMLRLRTNENDFKIMGHPDVIRKQNEKLQFFDENDPWYKRELKNLVKEIERAGVIVEVNTGSVARGYMKTPYPSKQLLEMLSEKKIPVTISSDCHNKDFLDFYFEEAVKLLEEVGYKELVTTL